MRNGRFAVLTREWQSMAQSQRTERLGLYSSATGEPLWIIPSGGGDIGFIPFNSRVDIDAAGDIVITGSVYSQQSGTVDLRTAKYRGADGTLAWESKLGTQSAVEAGVALASIRPAMWPCSPYPAMPGASFATTGSRDRSSGT